MPDTRAVMVQTDLASRQLRRNDILQDRSGLSIEKRGRVPFIRDKPWTGIATDGIGPEDHSVITPPAGNNIISLANEIRVVDRHAIRNVVPGTRINQIIAARCVDRAVTN